MTKIQSIKNRVAKLVKQAAENPPIGDTLSPGAPEAYEWASILPLLYSLVFAKGAPLRFGENGSVLGNRLWSSVPWARDKWTELQDWYNYVHGAPERANGILRMPGQSSTPLTNLAHLSAELRQPISGDLYKDKLGLIIDPATGKPIMTPSWRSKARGRLTGTQPRADIPLVDPKLRAVEVERLQRLRSQMADLIDGEIALKRLDVPGVEFPAEYRASGLNPQAIETMRDRFYAKKGPDEWASKPQRAYGELKDKLRENPELPLEDWERAMSSLGESGSNGGALAYDYAKRMTAATHSKAKGDSGARVTPPFIDVNGDPIMVTQGGKKTPAQYYRKQIQTPKTKKNPHPKTQERIVPLEGRRPGTINAAVPRSGLKTAPFTTAVKHVGGSGAIAGLLYLLGKAHQYHDNNGEVTPATPDTQND